MDDETKIARNKESKKLYYVNNFEKIKEREKLRYETKKQIMTEEQKQQQVEYQKQYRLKNIGKIKQKENEYNEKRKAERKWMKEARHRQFKYKHDV